MDVWLLWENLCLFWGPENSQKYTLLAEYAIFKSFRKIAKNDY